jgi:hypothetical protein
MLRTHAIRKIPAVLALNTDASVKLVPETPCSSHGVDFADAETSQPEPLFARNHCRLKPSISAKRLRTLTFMLECSNSQCFAVAVPGLRILSEPGSPPIGSPRMLPLDPLVRCFPSVCMVIWLRLLLEIVLEPILLLLRAATEFPVTGTILSARIESVYRTQSSIACYEAFFEDFGVSLRSFDRGRPFSSGWRWDFRVGGG